MFLFSKIKKLFWGFTAAFVMSTAAFCEGFSFPSASQVFSNPDSPFACSWGLDGTILGIGAVTNIVGYTLDYTVNRRGTVDVSTRDLSTVNSFDSRFACGYSKSLDTFSLIALGVSAVGVPAVSFGAGFLCDDLSAAHLEEISVMYAESLLLANGTKEIIKNSVDRYRPYMYFDEKNEDDFSDYDYKCSLPSGHTAFAFTSAAFTSYVYCSFFPKSWTCIPVVGVSFAAAAFTGYLRVASGNHFVTDVIAGAAIGTFWGFLVPVSHRMLKVAKDRNSNVEVSLLPAGCEVKVHL